MGTCISYEDFHFVSTGKDIEKACQGIYPLQNTFVRKVKVLRSPKFDVTKLMEVHGDYSEEVSGQLWTSWPVSVTLQLCHLERLHIAVCHMQHPALSVRLS